MSAAHPKYRLFESTGFLFPDLPAFADSDDFDALCKWARDHNEWKGRSARALIVSDEGRFWKVPRNGEIVEISNAPQQSGGSQVKRYAARLARGPSPGDGRYELPPAERQQHKTIHVPAHDSPEVEDALDAIDEINRPRATRPQKRLTAAENKAIEQHAVDLVCRYFEDRNYTTADVGWRCQPELAPP